MITLVVFEVCDAYMSFERYNVNILVVLEACDEFVSFE